LHIARTDNNISGDMLSISCSNVSASFQHISKSRNSTKKGFKKYKVIKCDTKCLKFALSNQKTLYIAVKYNPKTVHLKSYLKLDGTSAFHLPLTLSHMIQLYITIEEGRVGGPGNQYLDSSDLVCREIQTWYQHKCLPTPEKTNWEGRDWYTVTNSL
jgi:hypothetical protein